MDLSVITVTWNSTDTILRQIKSVRENAVGVAFEQIIVDNGSDDGTAELVEKNYPEVKIIKNQKNAGFGRANNQAVAIAGGRFLLFLNPDMELKGEIAPFLSWFEQHPEIGVAGCGLTRADGQINLNAAPRRFPRLWEQLVIILKLPHLFPRMLDRYLYRDVKFTSPQPSPYQGEGVAEVDSVRGAFMLVRRELKAKLGGRVFDPRYFIWFEDVDLCREAKRLGYKVVYNPALACVDPVGTSFKRRNFFWKQKQYIVSAAKYFWKWGL